MIYKLRIPALSLIWIRVEADSEDEALQKLVKLINAKAFDYSDKSLWEIEIDDTKDNKENVRLG